MSPVAIVLLAAAVVLVVACEWPRLTGRFGAGKLGTARRGTSEGRRLGQRRRQRAKTNLRVVHPDHEEFARSVERDLASLPTIDEQDVKRR